MTFADIIGCWLRRPTVEFGTYERWVNPPLFDGWTGAATPGDVRAAIDAAAERAAELRKPQPTTTPENPAAFPDPAITRLFLEVVQVFPRRRTHPIVSLGSELVSAAEVLGFSSGNWSGPTGKTGMINITVIDAAGTDEVKSANTGASVKIRPGHIYELRIYGAMPKARAEVFLPERCIEPV